MTTAKQGKLRDLDTIPQYEVEDAVNKIKRKREKNRLIREELERQAQLEHPTIAKALPYLRVIGVSVAVLVFCLALWIIFQVNASINVPI